MKFKEIKDKNIGELQKMLQEKRETLRAFRFGIAGSKVRNVREGRGLRRDIARILTAVRAATGK